MHWLALGACALGVLWLLWAAASGEPRVDPKRLAASADAPAAASRPAPAREERPKTSPIPSGALAAVPPMIDRDGPTRVSALRAAFERERPDATAAEAETRIRVLFEKQENADLIFRKATCTRSVCQLSLNWSPELSPAYNQGLIEVVREFTKEMSFEPDGEPTDTVPMRVLVARPGHSVQSLLEDEKRLERTP